VVINKVRALPDKRHTSLVIWTSTVFKEIIFPIKCILFYGDIVDMATTKYTWHISASLGVDCARRVSRASQSLRMPVDEFIASQSPEVSAHAIHCSDDFHGSWNNCCLGSCIRLVQVPSKNSPAPVHIPEIKVCALGICAPEK
jgi:hypothetical protein